MSVVKENILNLTKKELEDFLKKKIYNYSEKIKFGTGYMFKENINFPQCIICLKV